MSESSTLAGRYAQLLPETVLLDPTATVVLTGAPGRRFWLIVASLILILSGPIVAATGRGSAVSTVFGVLLFVCGVWLFGIQLLRPDRLIFARDDFSYRSAGRTTHMAWSEVAEFGVMRTRRRRVDVVQVGIRFKTPRSRLVEQLISGPGGTFDNALPESYGLPVDDLCAVMEAWRLAAAHR
jgi:hypothetical protein